MEFLNFLWDSLLVLTSYCGLFAKAFFSFATSPETTFGEIGLATVKGLVIFFFVLLLPYVFARFVLTFKSLVVFAVKREGWESTNKHLFSLLFSLIVTVVLYHALLFFFPIIANFPDFRVFLEILTTGDPMFRGVTIIVLFANVFQSLAYIYCGGSMRDFFFGKRAVVSQDA